MMRVTQDEEASVAERTDLDDKAGEQAPLRRPRWEELPLVPDSQARSAWGVFGDDDELGGVNLVSADCAVQAAALVRTGRSFRLDLPLEYPSPPIFTREPFRHEVFDIAPLEQGARTIGVKADDVEFEATVRIDTPQEWLYYRAGGILQHVLRRFA